MSSEREAAPVSLPKDPIQPNRKRWGVRMFALSLSAVLAGCGVDESTGAKLFPGRVSGAACDAKTGAPIAGATVVITKWTGTAWDESPSTLMTQTTGDGRFAVNTGVARRVQVEIGVEKYHPMGWLYAGEKRFCLEPVTAQATGEIKIMRVGVEDGRPFGFRFDSSSETSVPSEWDIGPTSTPSENAEVVLQFASQGGAIAVDPANMMSYSFEHDFVAPQGAYESRLRIGWEGRHRVGTCWFFRDASGANFGKALVKTTFTGRERARNWHVEAEYVYRSDGERHIEPKWRTVVPRWPVK